MVVNNLVRIVGMRILKYSVSVNPTNNYNEGKSVNRILQHAILSGHAEFELHPKNQTVPFIHFLRVSSRMESENRFEKTYSKISFK